MTVSAERASLLDGALTLSGLSVHLCQISSTSSKDLHTELADWVRQIGAWLESNEASLDPAEADEAVKLLIECAFQYYLDGRDVGRAAGPLAAAVRLSENYDLKARLRRSLSIRGLILGSIGDTAAALESLGRALDLARVLNDLPGQAAAWENMGGAFCDASLYGEAKHCFEQVMILVRGITDFKLHREFHHLHGIAICDLWLGDYESGLVAARESLKILAEPWSERAAQLRVAAEANCAQLLLALGRSDEALIHSCSATRIASGSDSTRSRLLAAITEGLVEVYRGDEQAGLRRIESTVNEAKGIRGVYVDFLHVSAEVYERAGRLDAALAKLHQIIAINQEGASGLLRYQSDVSHPLHPQRRERKLIPEVFKAIALQKAVDERLESLTNMAITNALRAGHDHYRIFRIGKLARLFADAEGWGTEAASKICLAGRLCDIGMVAVPDGLLRKTRTLSAGERLVMHEHTRIGPLLLAQSRLDLMEACAPSAQFHHERWDGNGPWSLVGDETPVDARVISLCEYLETLTHPTLCRPALPLAAALDDIQRLSGSAFDPVLSSRFITFVRELSSECRDYEAFLRSDAKGCAYISLREEICAVRR